MAELSTREKEIAAAAWRCFPTHEFPKINYEALAKAASINTAKTASNTWGTFKKKLSEAEDPTRVDLTEREHVVSRVAWLCVEDGNVPKINAAVMVEMGLFKTVKEADPDKTATNTWWSIKKKLQAGAGGNNVAAAAAGPSTAAPKTGKRKATAAATEGAAAAPPAAKKPRKARKSKASTQEKEGAASAAEETAAREPPAMNPQYPADF